MKLLARFRFVLLVLAGIGLVAATFFTLRNDGDQMRVVGRLGPTPGPNSQGHIKAKRAYLERQAVTEPGTAAAGLVSLAKLTPAAEAAALVAGMKASVVFVLYPGGEPEALPIKKGLEATVGARRAEFAGVVRGEVASLEAQLRTAKDPEKQALMKSLVERRNTLASTGPDCGCVYAIAVEDSTLGALSDLQQQAAVRLVDVPRPVTGELAGWELTPIMPA